MFEKLVIFASKLLIGLHENRSRELEFLKKEDLTRKIDTDGLYFLCIRILKEKQQSFLICLN